MELLRHSIHVLFLLLLVDAELTELERLYDFRSTRTQDYESGLSQGYTDAFWIRARATAVRDPSSFATLSQEVGAQPHWGRRLSLEGWLSFDNIAADYYARLFLRVILADGTTVAFDSMKLLVQRAGDIVSERARTLVPAIAVVDVPGPLPDADICPDENSLPAFIQAGIVLRGGRGFASVVHPTLRSEPLQAVSPRRLGAPPWEPLGYDIIDIRSTS